MNFLRVLMENEQVCHCKCGRIRMMMGDYPLVLFQLSSEFRGFHFACYAQHGTRHVGRVEANMMYGLLHNQKNKIFKSECEFRDIYGSPPCYCTCKTPEQNMRL